VGRPVFISRFKLVVVNLLEQWLRPTGIIFEPAKLMLNSGVAQFRQMGGVVLGPLRGSGCHGVGNRLRVPRRTQRKQYHNLMYSLFIGCKLCVMKPFNLISSWLQA